MLKNDHIKIGDFGFAVYSDITTKLGRGTEQYMSPEGMDLKESRTTTKADIW